jgi:hypothetical protein
MAGSREPALQERGAGCQRHERQADRCRKQADEPECNVGRRRRTVGVRDPDRHRHCGGRENAEMDHRTHPKRHETYEQMGVGVAGQQRALKEHQRHRPYRGSAAEPGQHHLGEHRLHRKQEQRGYEQGEHEDHRRETQRCSRPRRALRNCRMDGGHLGLRNQIRS